MPTKEISTMHIDQEPQYRARLGLSWNGSPRSRTLPTMTVAQLADRLEGIAEELQLAYQSAPDRKRGIALALEQLDELQAEL